MQLLLKILQVIRILPRITIDALSRVVLFLYPIIEPWWQAMHALVLGWSGNQVGYEHKDESLAINHVDSLRSSAEPWATRVVSGHVFCCHHWNSKKSFIHYVGGKYGKTAVVQETYVWSILCTGKSKSDAGEEAEVKMCLNKKKL